MKNTVSYNTKLSDTDYLKNFLTMLKWRCTNTFVFVCLLLPVLLNAQKKPSNFVLGTYPAATPGTSYNIAGFGNNYPTLSTYNLHYGQQNSSTTGFNRIVKLFTVNGTTYSFAKGVPGAKPFKKVIVNRNSSQVKNTALFETSTVQAGTNVYLTPDYVGNMPDLINSYVINRGTDNVFINQGITANNIERFDLLLNNPIVISPTVNLASSGFLLLERGGNDIFKAAAITGLNGDAVTAFNNPVTIKYTGPGNTDWGGTGQSMTSVVMQQVVGTDADLKPSQNILSQEISGVFVSFADMGVTSGSTVYGIGVFPGDVTLTGANLLDISQYSKTTSETGNYGLDFMAGGGFFTKAILIKGTVWNDINGDAAINNGETGIANGLWANLTDPSGKVVSSIKVNSDGTYTLFVPDNGIVTGNYSVVLTNTEKYEGDMLTTADSPQNGFSYTGTNFNNTPNTTNLTGVLNIGSIGQNDITGVNFGIGIPVAGPLPVTMGDFKASIFQDELKVQWTTLTETNNEYFDVEASADGKTFTKIGTVQSSAINGNSVSPLSYTFTAPLPATVFGISLGILALGGISISGSRYKRAVLAFAVITGLCMIIPACVKKDTVVNNAANKMYVRIAQVDIDGQKTYSKVIVVTR